MSKKYLLECIEMSDDALCVELENIGLDELRRLFRIALKEQDRDTRHACAEACMGATTNSSLEIVSKAYHDICMNVKAV